MAKPSRTRYVEFSSEQPRGPCPPLPPPPLPPAPAPSPSLDLSFCSKVCGITGVGDIVVAVGSCIESLSCNEVRRVRLGPCFRALARDVPPGWETGKSTEALLSRFPAVLFRPRACVKGLKLCTSGEVSGAETWGFDTRDMHLHSLAFSSHPFCMVQVPALDGDGACEEL